MPRGRWRRVEHAPLRNTFGIAAHTGLLIETDDAADLPALFADELAGTTPLVIGGGSNLLIVEDPPLALHLNAQRIEVVDAQAGIVRAEAGVEWHRFVLWTLEHSFAGVENLADADPPIYPNYVQANTDPSQYEVLGRRYFVRLNYRL